MRGWSALPVVQTRAAPDRPKQAQPPRESSEAHEVMGVEAPGFMQVGHGKLVPLKRVSPGDLMT